MTATFDRLAQALAGQYRVEKEIGAGGMATVYLAEDLKHRRRVAVKVLRPDLAAALGATRFTQEIEIAARLQHPHILPVHDSGEADGFLYYVMPYVEGESLRERLSHRGEFPIHEAVRLLVEVADALAYAHAHHVVHRDIKPENIMISGRHALVMDFGVAKAVSEASGRNKLTTAGVALGTPAYMAPEQASADPNLDQRVDIYALGVLGYELLSGQPPFTGGTPQQVLAAHITIAPEPVTTRRPTVSAQLASVIMRALEKRPADRWQTAEEMLTQLEPLATPSGGMTPSQTRPVQGITIGRQLVPRWLVVGAALFVLATALGWAFIRGRAPTRVVEPDRTQVTFTGNAWTPALSADGQRIAFSTRHCVADGSCTYDLIVQDVGGAGSTTVLRGWASIWTVRWSSSGRFLMVEGFEGLAGRWGVFSLSALGGSAVRYFGCCFLAADANDKLLLTHSLTQEDSARVFRITLDDGIVRDSFAFPKPRGSAIRAYSLGNDGRLFLSKVAQDRSFLITIGADGRPLDSLAIEDPLINPSSPEAYVGGRHILVARGEVGGNGDLTLLAYGVSASGRIAHEADTVLRDVRGSWYSELNGSLLNGTGPTEYQTWMLRRDSPRSMQFTQQLLASATAPIGGVPSPDGTRVLLARQVIQGGQTLTQLSLMPSDSGAETPTGPPRAIRDYEWSPDGRALVVAVRRGDTVDVGTQEIATGRIAPITQIESDRFGGMSPLQGGGVVIRERSALAVDLRGVPGRADTTFTLPPTEGTLAWDSPSPDGKMVLIPGWDPSDDSIIVRRLTLATGEITRLGAFYADGVQYPSWLSDGSIVIPLDESASTRVWYLFPAGGGKPVRLGSPPRSADATYRISADGRRAIARLAVTRPDIYVVRNFRELMER